MHRIIERIARAEARDRDLALSQLLILAGLRRLEDYVEEEARKMPILNDILEHRVLGREFKRGRQEGRQEGELALLRRLIAKRFGAVPPWAEQKLKQQSEQELSDLGVRLLGRDHRGTAGLGLLLRVGRCRY